MRKAGLGWVVGAVLLLGAATVWGLSVSVGMTGTATKRSELPDAGFDKEVGKAETVVRAEWGGGRDQVGNSREGEPKGPDSFGVDDRERVYVLDQINTRVVRYVRGSVDATFALPDAAFEDLAVMRDRFAVMSRDTERRVLVFDAERGLVATLPVAAQVPPVYRLFIDGMDVCVETPSPTGTVLHKVGDLNGTPADAAEQMRARFGFPTAAGTSITGGLTDKNSLRIDISDGRGTTKTKLRMRSPRDIAAVSGVFGDKAGNVVVVYGLYKQNQANPDDVKGRLVIARYTADGELAGRVETKNRYMPQPFRDVTLSESGDVYQLATDDKGVSVLKWSLSQ